MDNVIKKSLVYSGLFLFVMSAEIAVCMHLGTPQEEGTTVRRPYVALTQPSKEITDALSSESKEVLIRKLLGYKGLSTSLCEYMKEVAEHYRTLVGTLKYDETKNILIETAKLLETALGDAASVITGIETK
jgi:hypothetical protein